MSAAVKAITLWQPWASLIAVGAKTIETRGRATSYRGTLLIHAAKRQPPHLQRVGPWSVHSDLACMEDGATREIRQTGSVWNGELVLDRFDRGLAHPLPLGAVVAVAEIVDCVPMTTHADIGDPECIVVHGDGTADHCMPSWEADQDDPPANVVRIDEVEIPDGAHLIRDISDQLPYGDFRPGRFGLLLEDVRQLSEPVPARGQQAWPWTPDPALVAECMERVT